MNSGSDFEQGTASALIESTSAAVRWRRGLSEKKVEQLVEWMRRVVSRADTDADRQRSNLDGPLTNFVIATPATGPLAVAAVVTQ